jgi:hypothetical protein
VDLNGAKLTSTNLAYADLRGANLSFAWLNGETNLNGIILDQGTLLGSVRWNDAPLTLVNWSQAKQLGDEWLVRTAKGRVNIVQACRYVARSYRALAVAMRQQGLLIQSSQFRLREQRLERRALRLERKYGSWLFSGLLDLVAGYGERLGRILVGYLAVIATFATAYLLLGNGSGLIPGPVDAFVFSLTSFHGRGFFPSESIGLHHPLTILAALEAVVGLFIELILIATFSRRFLGN